MKTIRILMLFICIYFISCSFYKPPEKYDFDNSATINKSYDETWNKIVKWFFINKIQIYTIDKASGVISTEYNTDDSGNEFYKDCGKFSGAETIISSSKKIDILVEKISENETRVNINTVFFISTETSSAMFNLLTNSNEPPSQKQYNCESTGYLEQDIFNFIK